MATQRSTRTSAGTGTGTGTIGCAPGAGKRCLGPCAAGGLAASAGGSFRELACRPAAHHSSSAPSLAGAGVCRARCRVPSRAATPPAFTPILGGEWWINGSRPPSWGASGCPPHTLRGGGQRAVAAPVSPAHGWEHRRRGKCSGYGSRQRRGLAGCGARKSRALNSWPTI
jgi:hypothetical protein